MSKLPNNICNLIYTIKEVGRNIKSTKVKHIWELTVDNVHHVVELFDSKLSGKMKIVRDGTTVFYEEE